MSSSLRFCSSGWICASVCIVTYLLNYGLASPVVRIHAGSVKGKQIQTDYGDVDAFLGIPYAQPPVGNLRLSRPRPAEAWNGTYAATKFPAPCFQPDQVFNNDARLNYSSSSEDCLYINVWRPASACINESACETAELPVLVFLHGGGFQFGDSGLRIYDGTNFVARTNVVFVSLNYRVYFYGFLSAERPALPGNMGLWDQLMALKWVKRNIRRFGGNERDVTLSGHSAGAIAAGMHALSPQSRGLFRRLLLQSGTPLTMIVALSYSGITKFVNTAVTLGCYDTGLSLDAQIGNVVGCLKRLDHVSIRTRMAAVNIKRQMFLPVYGDDMLPFHPLDEKNTDIHIREVFLGTVRDEGTFIVYALRAAMPYLMQFFDLDYRLAVTLGLKFAFDIPTHTGKSIVRAYFGDYSVSHDDGTIVDILSELIGDAAFDCPTNLFATKAAEQGAQTYRYLFAYKPSYSFWPDWAGIAHGCELPLTMGSLGSFKSEPRFTSASGKYGDEMRNGKASQEDKMFMEELLQIWSAFIRDGKPKIPLSNAEWPKYSAENPEFVYLQPNNYTRGFGPKKERCEYWRPFLLKQSADVSTEKTSRWSEPSSTDPSPPAKPTRPAVQYTAPKSDVRLELYSSSYIPEPSIVLFTFFAFIIWICMA
nr:acetylcholinesterase-1-like [Dermacentor andersoni]